MTKIIVVAGQSAGHLFPALAFVEELKEKRRADVLMLIPAKEMLKGLVPSDYKVEYIKAINFASRFSWKNLGAFLDLIKGFFRSLSLVYEFKPNIAVGFGGINCVPVLIVAWLMRIKTVIHEQNIIPGKANRVLAKIADKIAVSFQQTARYLDVNPEKIVLTGNPLRRSLKRITKADALSFFALDPEKFTFLVMGGSQGSHKINTVFCECLSWFQEREELQVLHICGKKDYDFLKAKYAAFKPWVKLFPFLKEMQYAYSAADLAISRAGALTVCELIFFRLPAILIPYPFANRHQSENARFLQKTSRALVIEEARLSVELLRDEIQRFISKEAKSVYPAEDYSLPARDTAASLLAEEVLSMNG